MIYREANALNNGCRGPDTESIQYSDGHDGRLPADARYAHAIVPSTGNGACDVGAMPITVHGIVIEIHQIRAVKREGGAAIPHVACKVFMVIVDAGIQHGHHDASAIGNVVPGLFYIDIGTGRSTELPGVLEAPKLVVLRIV